MAGVLVYAEARDRAISGVSREVVSAGRGMADAFGGELDVLLLGGTGIAEEAASLAEFGADRILVAEDAALAVYHPDAALRALEARMEEREYAAILFPASAQGKDLAPRFAARLRRGLATEVVEWSVDDEALVVRRPVYAGKAIATLRFPHAPAIASLRPNVFAAERRDGKGEVERIEVEDEPRTVRVRGIERGEKDRMDVAEASVIVSGGRGLQDPSNWHVLEDLADALGDGVALGASRAVVDAGWRPHAEQVGQTGKTVSPNLYFAIGISGAIQHLAGMRTAKTIVAVNKDPEAPIFKVADYGVVGDLFEVVPRLADEVRKVRGEE